METNHIVNRYLYILLGGWGRTKAYKTIPFMSPFFFHQLSWSLMLLQCLIIITAYLWGIFQNQESGKVDIGSQGMILFFQLLPWFLALLCTLIYPLNWPWSLIKAMLYILVMVGMLFGGLWREAYLISDQRSFANNGGGAATLYIFLILGGFFLLFEGILQFANTF